MSAAVTQAARAEKQDLARQARSAEFGLWVFLASESLFFGALFATWTIGRLLHPESYMRAAAEAQTLIGTANTALLLTGSLLLWIAIREATAGRKAQLQRLLLVTIAIGLVFMGLKMFEYWLDVRDGLVPGFNYGSGKLEPGTTEIFWWLYFVMTGLHALHLTIGICLVTVLQRLVKTERIDWREGPWVRNCGLYWSYVDLIWVLFYPLIYLSGPSS